jgi:hypothetical protein
MQQAWAANLNSRFIEDRAPADPDTAATPTETAPY